MTVFLSHDLLFGLFVRTSSFLSHLLQILYFTISYKGLEPESVVRPPYVVIMQSPEPPPKENNYHSTCP